MQRLAELEHHVVRDVDDGMDRAQTRAAEPLAEPERRTSAGAKAAHDPAGEPRATLAGEQLHRETLPGARARGFRLAPRERQAASSRELARDPEHAEAVAAVRRHVDLEDRVGESQVVGERVAERRVAVEQQQAVRLVRQLELLARAQHPVRLHAAQLCGADRLAAGQRRAHARERRLDPCRDVRRAADNLHALAAVIDGADREPIGVRVARDREHLGDDDAVERRAGALDGLDLEPRAREVRRDALGVAVDGYEITEPVDAYAHAGPSGELLEEA